MRRLAYFAAGVVLWTLSALAFANAPVGSVIENISLPALTGGEQKFLSETNVSVFIFLKPGQEHSNQVMVQIAKCEKELADKPVHWCAIVSDRVPKSDVESALRESGISMPVLIDQGDVLYAKLGVFLHPVVGITDRDQRLVAYQPFAKVNYAAFIRAQIRHALGEINDAELAEILKPPAAILGGEISVAHRFFRLAEKQLQVTNYDQALTNINTSLAKNPTAEAHSLRGRILLGKGNRAEALAAFQTALKLDPHDAQALEGVNECKENGK